MEFSKTITVTMSAADRIIFSGGSLLVCNPPESIINSGLIGRPIGYIVDHPAHANLTITNYTVTNRGSHNWLGLTISEQAGHPADDLATRPPRRRIVAEG